MTTSLCETCKNMREVCTARSRFLLCELSVTKAEYAKYPAQPVERCAGYQQRNSTAVPEQGEQVHGPAKGDESTGTA